MKIILKMLLCMLAIAISLCGCGLFTTTTGNIENPETPVIGDATLDGAEGSYLTADKAKTNNIWGTASSMGQYPATGRNGFYLPRGAVQYYDVKNRALVKCCSIAGCTHVGPICPANQTGLLSFLECGEYWCVFARDASNNIQLYRIVPSTGEQKVFYIPGKWKKRAG